MSTRPIVRPPKTDIPAKSSKPCILRPKAEAVTIAIGMKFKNGIVLAADQQISAHGYHKYEEPKIFPVEFGNYLVFLSYADTPSLAKEAKERIAKHLVELANDFGEEAPITITNRHLRDAAQTVLVELAQQHFDDLPLQMFIACAALGTQPELWVYKDKGFHEVNDFEVLGAGDASIIRYLRQMHTTQEPVSYGENLAVYLIEKGKTHIDGCGGPADVVSIENSFTWNWLKPSEVATRYAAMQTRETELLRQIVKGD